MQSRHRGKTYPMAALLGCAMLYSAIVQAADPAHGARVFQAQCAKCHGSDGAPTMPGVPDFSRGAPLMKSDIELLKFIRRGRGIMPAYQGLLTDNDILDAISYLRTLR
ncbi:MAG TPA: cytochrome c [Gammaproteobacteria bacterium]|nr:cytochrome c [Gammaproteobacteria bacterium]